MIGTPPGALDAPFVQPRRPPATRRLSVRAAPADHGRMRRIAQLCERLRSLTITPDAEGAFDDARRRVVERTPRSERRVDLAMAAAFLVAATALALAAPPAPRRRRHRRRARRSPSRSSPAWRSTSRWASPCRPSSPWCRCCSCFRPGSCRCSSASRSSSRAIVDALTGPRHLERIARGFCDAWFSLAPATVFVLGSVDGVHAADWPWWLAAFAAQLGLDMLVSSFGEWLRAGRWPRLHLRELGVVAFVDGALAPIGLLVAVVAADAPVALLAVLPLGALIAALAQERRHRLEQAVELGDAYQGVALLLGEVIEDDDHYTGEHSRGVVQLSSEIAQELGLGERDRRLVEFGALLHDVGKVRVPNEIINKAGPLDDDEWAIMRRHTIDGEAMLARVGGMMQEVGRIVRGSHEDWDGTGYPDGLAGEEIPLASRIVSCADAYSAMTTDRSYRKALGHAGRGRRAPALRGHAVRPARRRGRDPRRRPRGRAGAAGAARRPRGRRGRRGVARLRSAGAGDPLPSPRRMSRDARPSALRLRPARRGTSTSCARRSSRAPSRVPQRGQTPSRRRAGMTLPVWTPPPAIAERFAARIALRRRSSSLLGQVVGAAGSGRSARARAPRRPAGCPTPASTAWSMIRAFTGMRLRATRARKSLREISAASGPRRSIAGSRRTRPRRRLSRSVIAPPSSNAIEKRSQRSRSTRGRGSPASSPSTTIRPAIPRWMPSAGPSSDVSHHIDFPRRSALTSERPTSASAISPGACGRQT